MKKFAKRLLITLAFIIVLFLMYVLVTFHPIMRGMAAKTMCSCVYVAGRSPESVIRKECLGYRAPSGLHTNCAVFPGQQ